MEFRARLLHGLSVALERDRRGAIRREASRDTTYVIERRGSVAYGARSARTVPYACER